MTNLPENVQLLRPHGDGPPEVLGLAEGLAQVADQLATLPVPEGLLALAHELRHVRTARQRLADRERAIEAGLTALRDIGKNVVVERGLSLERKGGKDRKQWDHRGVAVALLANARAERVDTMTGEVQMSEGEAVMNAILSSAGISYWKVTELRGRGIEVDDYCQSEPGRVTWAIIE